MCSILTTVSKHLTKEQIQPCFARTIPRGPDMSRFMENPIGYMAFNRLAIMGLTTEGMQPFELNRNMLVCNGEIYGFRKMKEKLKDQGYHFVSDSDCEILLPLYEQLGTEMFKVLGSEFALCIYDDREKSVIAARDPIGIRPLFYGYDDEDNIMFASEACALEGLCKTVMPFPPGHYYKDGEFHRYINLTDVTEYTTCDVEEACQGIRDRLVKSVKDRLCADAPLGFLLSGGLDSSLVCAISAAIVGDMGLEHVCDEKNPETLLAHLHETASDQVEDIRKRFGRIRTFAIGMEEDAIDLKYARKVADFIGADHTEVFMTPEEVIRELPNVIRILGTWDITTIRASMGMYLCCKWIHEHTDIRVLMTGEISDELFGYKYTDYAPNPEAFQQESKKRVDELYMYDVLRADRCIAANSLEARVPFGDTDFVRYVMSIDPDIKMNRYDMGKYLLRHAFEKDKILPDEILWRQKAAFSDAVGHSMVDDLKAYAEDYYTDEEYEKRRKFYTYCTPFTKESLLYREIFEQFYPGRAMMIKDYWMPNKSWKGCDVNDPSARVLGNYGASGK